MSEKSIASTAFLRHYQSSKRFRDQWMEVNLTAAIGIQVREIRLQRGWTQLELAQRTDMKQERISAIENGANVSINTLSRLAAVFDIALRVEFVEHGTFIKWIFEIYGTGVKVVTPFGEDLAFLKVQP